jgi:hypothetical protein
MKKILLIIIISILPFFSFVSLADDDSWTIIPKTEQETSRQSDKV